MKITDATWLDELLSAYSLEPTPVNRKALYAAYFVGRSDGILATRAVAKDQDATAVDAARKD